MGTVEIGQLVLHGKLIENARLEVSTSEDMYFESAVSPGFSDAHAHPQVVDVGEGGHWRDSYEWLENRKLRVNEAAIRKDKELSALLAEATILSSIIDGVTMLSLTGSLEGNIEAVKKLKATPRVVLLPTVMNLDGWSLPENIFVKYVENSFLWDGYFSLGFFVHSIKKADISMLRASYNISRKLHLPFALHLSEGIDEVDALVEALGKELDRVIAVHCITSPEKCRKAGLKVVHCPTSNIYLYNRTLGSIEHFDSLGSDWPLVTGNLFRTFQDAVKLHSATMDLLAKATLGGYEIYNIKPEGDLVAFDDPIEKVLRGESRPVYVFVKSKPIVKDGIIDPYGLSRTDMERIVRERVNYAFEKYGL